MASQWFCQFSVSGETIGPLSSQQLRSLVEQGKLSPEDSVRQGESAWVPARRVKGLFARGTPEDGAAGMESDKIPASSEPPPAVAPPIAVFGETQAALAATPPVAVAISEPPPAVGIQIHVDDRRPAGPPPTAPASGSRRSRGGNPRLVVWLLVLLVVSALGAAAVAVWPRSRPEQPAEHSLAGKPAEASPPLKEVTPLGSLDELVDDVALPTSGGSSEKVQWTDAAEPIRRGDVSVRILSAEIGRPRLMRTTGRAARPAEDTLILKIQLRNESEARKWEYAGWGASSPASGVKLIDNLGNSYSQESWKGATIEGQLAKESLYPGKSLEDILVFQKPVDKAETLRLRLPASVFGEKETLDFAIPMSMVTVAEEAAASPPAMAAAKPEGPLPPGRGVPAIERGIAEMDQMDPMETKPAAKGEPESILDKVNQDTEAIGGGDQGKAAEADFEEMLRDRKDVDPARRDAEQPRAKSSPRKKS